MAPSEHLVANVGRAAATLAGIAALWAFWLGSFK
jgi:hypothetical protein